MTLPRQARAPDRITLRAQASVCSQPHLYGRDASATDSLRYIYRPSGDLPRGRGQDDLAAASAASLDASPGALRKSR